MVEFVNWVEFVTNLYLISVILQGVGIGILGFICWGLILKGGDR